MYYSQDSAALLPGYIVHFDSVSLLLLFDRVPYARDSFHTHDFLSTKRGPLCLPSNGDSPVIPEVTTPM